MIQILEENRKPRFSDQLMQGLGRASEVASTEIPKFFGEKLMEAERRKRQTQEDESISQLLGQDITGIHDPKMKHMIVENLMKGQQASRQAQANKPDVSGAVKALDTLEDMVSKSGIGFLGQVNPSAEARKNRGIFQSTQAAILPLFKGMFPRGMTEKEFKFIQENYIPQANDTEEKIRGKILGLRQLINEQDLTKSPDLESPAKNTRPPLSSFSR